MKKIFLFTILLLVLIPISFSTAQSIPSDTNNAGVTLAISPENPEPGQSFAVTVESFTYDLDRSSISWLVNGSLKKTGLGIKTFNYQAGKNGEKTDISIEITTPDNQKIISSVSFITSNIDLITEALSYTPPFYKGKALNPNQGTVLIVAIPNFYNTNKTKVSTQNIVYTWKKDGTVLGSQSGLGRNTLMINGSVPIRDINIEVSATTADNSITSSKNITVTNTSPKIIFYEDSPIYGVMFNKAITKTVNLLSDEFKVNAYPYFFNVGYTTSSNLNYTWSMNGSTIPNLDQVNSMLFRQDKKGSGSANVGLKIENTSRIFQFVEDSFNMIFQKQ